MAMPWSRAKELVRLNREDVTRQLALNCLFNTCFRIAAEAGVPLVVENVKGAQPWVGQARAHFGSFYFWGDIESVGSRIMVGRLKFGEALKAPRRASKNGGGSWFAVANNTESGHGQNPDGRKVPVNFHEHEKTGKPGRSFQSTAVADSFGWSKETPLRNSSSSSSSTRKAASAQIAKIPFPVASYIARAFKP